MPASELIERVAGLIAEVRPSLSPTLQPGLAELDVRLREPPRIAVVGAIKSGKSTLVNALLGQRVAPTAVGECTQIVTWFHYGHPQRVVIRMRDGTEREGGLTAEGMLPADLGIAPGTVDSIHVYLANEVLQWMTVIDTPGLGSASTTSGAQTEALLAASRDSEAAAARADALLFLITNTIMEDDVSALALFHNDGNADATGSAANAVAVLSRADQLGVDGEVWDVALELAGRYAAVLRNHVSTVVPVIGLLAETAEAAVLTESAAADLRTLAAMEPSGLEKLLWSTDRFISGDAPVAPEARERLLDMLDLYGVQRAIDLVRDGTFGAGALRRELSELSRISEVKHTIADYFRNQDHVLKVRSALDILWRMSYADPAAGPALRTKVEALRLDPVMQPVAELEVWHECCAGRITMPQRRIDDMRLLFTPGTPAGRLGLSAGASPTDIRAAAQAALGDWRAFMVHEASPAQALVARVVLRTLQILWAAAA